MKTFLPQNQFISNSAVTTPRTAGSAAASKSTPVADAAAASIPVSDGVAPDAPSETEGAVSVSTASSDIDCINEIFFYARKLVKGQRASTCAGCEKPEFVYETVDGGALYRCADCGKSVHFSAADLAAPSIIDEAALMAEVEETPLFLREDGYLQRREA